MDNPLLNLTGLPAFSQIAAEHVEPAIDRILEQNRSHITALTEATDIPEWDNVVRPIEDLNDRLERAWSPVRHMNSVVNSDPLRDAYNTCLPKLSAFATEMGQNEALYRAYQAIADRGDFQALDVAQRKAIENALRDFRLAGVALEAADKTRFKEISQALSTLASTFQENLLDAANAWEKVVTEQGKLAGLPDSALALARQTAEQRAQEGWVLTLDLPSYLPVMTYADERDLRREMYEAYMTRASDQGPHGGRWDNTEVMQRILALRHEKARLLGYANFAELSLVPKMAGSAQEVLGFLHDLAKRSLPVARLELEEIRTFARERHAAEHLGAWDIPYYAEKLRQDRYAISQEALRPYFPVSKVLSGMFAIVQRLYGIRIKQVQDVDVWHPDVGFYEIRDPQGAVCGQFYVDLYARPKKRAGAWMDECVVRRRAGDSLQLPVAYLTCNFTPPVGEDPSLLTHDEVTTLFHEFGHGLHHMLTRIDYPEVSGINGVAWDAVELPSQFMENWCWDRQALDLIAGHYDTGATLPAELYERMLAAKDFQAGMKMVRQLEFSLFDFRLHHEYDPKRGARIYEMLREVQAQVAVLQPPEYTRFAHGFAHIFAGGYAAGYYSYKWAEVLSSDAFSRFEENGIFDAATGRAFLHTVLEQGGSRDAMELFVQFRGREPRIDALLRHSGIGT